VGINADEIARAALKLLDEHGLDGLTMRLVAEALGVRAPTLYWHVKNKQHLLDAMAGVMFAEMVDGLEAPRRDESWQEWVANDARRMRRIMLRYRDGGRVFAGTSIANPDMPRVVELSLRTLQDAGFTLVEAGRGVTAILHFTTGYAIEEQARLGMAYGEDENPYKPETIANTFDPVRFPLTNQAAQEIFFADDSKAGFEHGVALIIAGMEHTRQSR
jgi:TetR/AcrR family tetracycline transcriptional repressor